ncbi:hypothetical protein [Streptomyces torulosus]|uniref:hypothetical protein n=1 Tax=Streptomyces torulosus TaxID=68276 RepID=UPI0006EB6DF6|nr:hypothetical protein [Streptomyces torulosus]
MRAFEFAPCPHTSPTIPNPRAIRGRQRHNVCHWHRQADDHPYYRALKPLLDAHAEQPAELIDSTPRPRQ